MVVIANTLSTNYSGKNKILSYSYTSKGVCSLIVPSLYSNGLYFMFIIYETSSLPDAAPLTFMSPSSRETIGRCSRNICCIPCRISLSELSASILTKSGFKPLLENIHLVRLLELSTILVLVFLLLFH